VFGFWALYAMVCWFKVSEALTAVVLTDVEKWLTVWSMMMYDFFIRGSFTEKYKSSLVAGV